MAKGIKRQIKLALLKVNCEISMFAKRDFPAGALASEGYTGGYRQALCDVIAALNGVPPSNSRYWPERHLSGKSSGQDETCDCDLPSGSSFSIHCSHCGGVCR